ncbi:hypothetical protein [Hymenobacter citatus]|uniref:hypothetical protein n=1 Tax=Hymenobacter citatus TaxID=2763506 RepID=UPI001FE727E3|nr:hypothetical protein [Hymenobacter citatus]
MLLSILLAVQELQYSRLLAYSQQQVAKPAQGLAGGHVMGASAKTGTPAYMLDLLLRHNTAAT